MDPDKGMNGDVRYTLVGVHRNLFSINSVTGDLELSKMVDREVKSSYMFQVKVHDLGDENEKR